MQCLVWLVDFSQNGTLGASQQRSDSVMIGLVLHFASVSTVDLATLKFKAAEHPPLATSPDPIKVVSQLTP
jgi:hypothetical protein